MILNDILVPASVAGASLGGTTLDGFQRGALHCAAGKPARLHPCAPTDAPRLVLPALTEAHCHLDKCHTIHRLGPVGGNLSEAIAAMMRDKGHWSHNDLRTRIGRGLSDAARAGCGAMRTHIDWGDTTAPPPAWDIAGALGQDHDMILQRAALMGIDKLADAAFCAGVARAVAQSENSVLGAFVLDHAGRAEGLQNLFAEGLRHGLPLDFHVDETLGDTRGLEAIAEIAIALEYPHPILCGHACNLMNIDGADLARITDKLCAAGISICALPTSNLYLQDRSTGTPDRRGVTRLRELHRAGVPILLGSDNVGDAFCPVGQHDPMAALQLGVLTAHLDPPLARWIPSVTTDARAAMGLPVLTVDTAQASQLRIADTGDLADLVAGRIRLAALSTPLL